VTRSRDVFSERASFELAPNALSVALSRARSENRPVLDLTGSNPTQADIAYDESAIVQALSSRDALRYEPSPFGLASARQAVAETLSATGAAVDPAQIALTSSTSEAYGFLFKLLADPGDEVLVPAPSYPLHEHLARLEGVACKRYRLAYDGAWHVDLDALRASVSPRCRAIVAVNPNNPTGSFLTADEFRAMASIGLPIVCDEVFAEYPLKEGRHVARAKDFEASLVFSLGGLSKLAALPQVKLAWIAVTGRPEQVVPALERLEVIADAFLSVGTPVQLATRTLLSSRKPALDAIRARTRSNLDCARSVLDGSAASLLDVEGGWYATLQLPATLGEEEWALLFLEKEGVYVHPGHFFDFESEPFVVLSLLTPEASFREGLRRIALRVGSATARV
jgi:alanine-synthesizing transaminase